MFKTIKEKYKAWRRGDVRVSAASRGRIYERKNPIQPADDGVKRADAKGILKLTKVRVIRADGSIEEINHG